MNTNNLKQLFAVTVVFALGYCSEQGLIPIADQCICPGYTLQLKCMVDGRGTTIWKVDGATDVMLRLRHDADFSADVQLRNGGAIEARGLSSSSNNCFMSLLTILISPDLNGVNVTCQHDNGTNIFTIDVYSIQLTTDLEPFSPPSYINLTNINTDGLTFEWTSVSPNCSAVSYMIASSGCGNCPSSTNSTSVICHGVQLDGECPSCLFSIRAVTCGDIMGNFGSSLVIQLKAANIPEVHVWPKYWQNTTITCLVSFITEIKMLEQELLSISGNDIAVLSYVVKYETENRVINVTEVSSDACKGNICRVEGELMMRSCSDIIVIVSGKSVLGTGPASLSKIDGDSSNFVTVSVSNAALTCTFINRQDNSTKSCIVKYGQCGVSLNQTARENSTSTDPYLVTIQLDSELNSYCYSVNASNDTYTVLVEGTITNGPHHTQLEGGAIAGIVIGIIAFLSVATLCFLSAVCIGYHMIKNKDRNKTYKEEGCTLTSLKHKEDDTSAHESDGHLEATKVGQQQVEQPIKLKSDDETDTSTHEQVVSTDPGQDSEVTSYVEGEDVDEPQDSKSKEVCKLPGCDRPRYREEGGKLHDFCGYTHAQEYNQKDNAQPIEEELQCASPNCKSKKRERPEGGYYNYCSLDCRDASGPGTCLLPGCNRRKYHDSQRNKTHDYCSRTCADKAKEQGLQRIKITQLQPSQEFIKISQQFKRDWARKKGACPEVNFVYVVSNSSREVKWNAYRKKLQEQNVEKHYHGTKVTCNLFNMPCNEEGCGICGIAKNGFDQKSFGKNCKLQRFGLGFYLAPNSSKCHDYTQGANGYRAMLLCDVCPGKKYGLQGNKTDLEAPPSGYNSVYGEVGRRLNYPEIVVYHPDAVLPRYIIVYQKDGIHKLVE